MPARTERSLDDHSREEDTGFAEIGGDRPAAGGGINVFSSVTRRWPLLMVGVLCGLVAGFLYHLRRDPVYQSSAQLLVIKKRADVLTTQGGDTRQAYLEDIVSTQVTLLRTENLLMSAGRLLNPQEVKVPLPATDRERAQVIGAGLTVSRDKETSGTGGQGGGSGFLILSYRAGDPDTCKAMLQAVIRAYQSELSAIYDEASQNRMRSLNDLIRVLETDREKTLLKKGDKSDEMRKITEEELPSIRARVSAQRDKEIVLDLEKVQLDKQLELARAAGTDKKKRLAAVFMLNSMARYTPGAANGTSSGTPPPELQLKLLQMEGEALREKLGDHHPNIRAHERKIAMLGELMFRGDGGDDDTDELWAIQQRLVQQKSAVEDSLARVRSLIAADRDALIHAGRLQDDIDRLSDDAANRDKDIKDRKKELIEVEATSSAGGYAARVMTEPAAGGKVGPVLMQSLMICVALGGMLGTGLAVLAEMSDQGFRTPAEVRQRLGLPVIGHLPRLEPLPALPGDPHPDLDRQLVVVHRPKSPDAESFRGVRTQLFFSTQGRRHQVIQVTSPNPGDGKSTLAANVAASIAQSGKRTVLVDCDFRKPRVHKIWNLPNPEVGMSTVVAGDTDLRDAVRKTEVPNLDVLPCGPRPANPAELLTSPAFVEILQELRESYDFVILDTPPMLAVSDPSVVAPRVDGVILTLRMSKKARPTAERAKELLLAVGANIIGVAVNGVSGRAGGGGGYGYGYGYQYNYEYADEYADDPEEVEALDAGGRPPLKG